jgi:hypothetical protein
MRSNGILGLVLVAMCSLNWEALAWNDTGHVTVAELAWGSPVTEDENTC